VLFFELVVQGFIILIPVVSNGAVDCIGMIHLSDDLLCIKTLLTQYSCQT